MNEQAAYFLHPHCIHAADRRRAALWFAMLQEGWMSVDEMLAVCRVRGE